MQRPVKLYSSHPISDRAHFKNCLLEEGPQVKYTFKYTQAKHGCVHTCEPLQYSRSPHVISGSHAIDTRKQPLGLSGLLWFSPPLSRWNVYLKYCGEKKKKKRNTQVKKILLGRGCLWILACGSCVTWPLGVLGCGSCAPSFSLWGLMICTGTLQGQLPRAFNPWRYDTMLNAVPSISLLFTLLSSSGSFIAITPC